MKKNLILLYAVLLASCSDATSDKTNDNDTASVAAPATGTDNTTSPTENAPAVCSNLLFFRQGTEIESTTFGSDGKVIQKERSRIAGVKTADGMLVATVESTDITDGAAAAAPLQYNCKCDGRQFYIDIAPIIGALDARGARMDVHELVFPVDIKDGQTLPDASVTVEMSLGEQSKSIKTKISYNHRKVEGTKSITTPAGTWNCYKIAAAIDMEMLDMDEQTKQMMDAAKNNMPSTHSVMWYSPEAGIVQFDVYVDGEMQSYSQITGIRKEGSAQQTSPAGLNKLVGTTFTDSRHITGLEGWEFHEGSVVSDIAAPDMLLVDVFQKGSSWMAMYAYKPDRDGEKHTIVQILEVNNVEKGWELKTALCRQNKKEDPDVVALVKAEYKEYMTNVKKAWRYNRSTKQFIEIDPKSVDCINEGLSLIRKKMYYRKMIV